MGEDCYKNGVLLCTESLLKATLLEQQLVSHHISYTRFGGYYGLFLTEESKTKLKEWLWLHGYDFNNDIIKGVLPNNWYLDHCTLLHRSQGTGNFLLEDTLGTTMAFRCNIPENPCADKIPHITICTFNGGKPVDSNNIAEWKDIEPIIVETRLEKR